MGMQRLGRPEFIIKPKSKIQRKNENIMKNANAELEEETSKQIDIVWHSLAIVLHRYHGWTTEQINELIAKKSPELWAECADYDMVSMIEMLWDECGIELMSENSSKRWFEVSYLNSDIAEMRDMQLNEWREMRLKQKGWVCAQITACALLSLHRMENWSDKAMGKVFEEIEEVKAEFNHDPEKLRKACDDETNFMIVDDDFMLKAN